MLGLGLDLHYPPRLAGGAAGGDPSFANVGLLIGGDTAIVDEGPAARALTFGAGNVTRDTVNKPFGVASINVQDGFNISVANGSWFQFGGGAFTAECLYRWDSNNTSQDSLMGSYDIFNSRSWHLVYNGNIATPTLQFVGSPSGGSSGQASILSAVWTPIVGHFYYIAVDRSGDVWRLYVADLTAGETVATMLNKATNTMVLAATTSAFNVPFALTGAGFGGQFKELRITKGVARYASDAGVAAPTAAFPRS